MGVFKSMFVYLTFAPIPGLIADDSTPGGTSSSGRLHPQSLAAPKRWVGLGRGPAEAAASVKQVQSCQVTGASQKDTVIGVL